MPSRDSAVCGHHLRGPAQSGWDKSVMARRILLMALDFAKRPDVKPGKAYYTSNGKWYVKYYGPTYENIFELTDVTPDDIELLTKVTQQQGKDDKEG